ncbi:MAG: SDR family oxidoreductase [Actinomycetota bacterium]
MKAAALTCLEGRRAVVIGASSGIGLACAVALGRSGAQVTAFARRLETMQAALLDAHQPQIDARPLDVTSRSQVEDELLRLVLEGPLDILVCAAGTNVPQRRLADLTQTAWRTLITTNLLGPASCVRAALPSLRRARGHVVLISSVSALWPDISGVGYQSSKAGLLALARAAAVEEGAASVRITSILPGIVDTELLDRRPEPPDAEMRTAALQPDDVATACMFVLSFPPRALITELTILPSQLQAVGATWRANV